MMKSPAVVANELPGFIRVDPDTGPKGVVSPYVAKAGLITFKAFVKSVPPGEPDPITVSV